MSNIQVLKTQLSNESVKKRFFEILGKKGAGFITSIINATNSNPGLAKCEPNTIIGAAAVAAALDLPIDNNLGFAYLIPYGTKCQFQVGFKGLIQLSLRSGQFAKLNVTAIYEGQLLGCNPLTEEYDFDFSIKSDKVAGYAGYMELVNGFKKTVYWTLEELISHGKKYSKSFSRLWADVKGGGQDSMCKKTVLKMLISKYAPMSIEMQTAHRTDQAVIKDINNFDDVEYADNPSSSNNANDFLSEEPEVEMVEVN